MSERIFTLAEARNLLLKVRPILEEVAADWALIQSLQPQVQKARDAATYDGYSPAGAVYVEATTRVAHLLGQVQEMGVLVKDLEKGLIDFPYLRNGRIVYLCWRLGEAGIAYWHDVEAGFAGREPLDETDA